MLVAPLLLGRYCCRPVAWAPACPSSGVLHEIATPFRLRRLHRLRVRNHRDGTGPRVLRHRHRRHRRHLLPARRNAGAAHLQQGDDRRQEALGHRRDRGRIRRQCAAACPQGHRERLRRGRHPRCSIQRQGTVRRQGREEPARAGRAVSGAGAARHARQRERAGLQGPQGQDGVVRFARIGPVAAAGRPARSARHDAQGHRRGPVVVHAVGRQDQGRQPDAHR